MNWIKTISRRFFRGLANNRVPQRTTRYAHPTLEELEGRILLTRYVWVGNGKDAGMLWTVGNNWGQIDNDLKPGFAPGTNSLLPGDVLIFPATHNTPSKDDYSTNGGKRYFNIQIDKGYTSTIFIDNADKMLLLNTGVMDTTATISGGTVKLSPFASGMKPPGAKFEGNPLPPGQFVWRAGTLANGRFVVTDGAALRIQGASDDTSPQLKNETLQIDPPKVLPVRGSDRSSVKYESQFQVQLTSGNLNLFGKSQILNGGTFFVGPSANSFYVNATSNAVFNNRGLLRVRAFGSFYFNPVLQNAAQATLQVAAGTLRLSGDGTLSHNTVCASISPSPLLS